MKVKEMYVKLGSNSPGSNSKDEPPALGSNENGKGAPRDYKCGGIDGKSDTGTFGGSYSRGPQGNS